MLEPGKGELQAHLHRFVDERPRPRRAKNVGGPITDATTATERAIA
jgi:hypothetical protein